MSMAESENDIRSVFTAYASGFDIADASAITKLFAYPATIWQSGESDVFADEAVLAKNVEALIDVFDEADIKRLIPNVRAVHVAGDAAFAHVLWRQEDGDGIKLNEFACRYLLLRRDGSWRIATVVSEAET